MSQYKSPTYAHTHKQSPFRASFGRSRSMGGVSAGGPARARAKAKAGKHRKTK